MRLFELIEARRFDIIDGDSVNWDIFDELRVNPQDLQEMIDYFLSSLQSNHQLPGRDYITLQGIAYWIRQRKPLTDRQMKYSILTMVFYWNELDLMKM